MFDLDLGLQSQTFFRSGLDGQSKFHPSVSLRADYYRNWDNERQSFTAAPFFRYDAQDSDRTHFDLREFFWTRGGDSWDLHLGVKQVFWGVTEFNHPLSSRPIIQYFLKPHISSFYAVIKIHFLSL